ncbi:MAG: apolipoprotein N-acyltransferase [Ignavibacterium sp.]|nr:apolipoprotein N-acyltransferase [Ignavibacterium sp.]MDW8374983.1 apolipoprotein N-acyltransferase [Ignavibacteriales bacterium]
MSLFKRLESNPELRKEKRIDRALLILSGILCGISFPPFPFPVTLLIFFFLIPYLFVIQKKLSLLDINKSSYFTFFFFSLITLYWVGSWQSKADPFLMIGGGVLVFFFPIVLLIISTMFYLTRRIFNLNIAIWLLPIHWVTVEYLLTLTDLKFPWLTLGHSLANFTVFIQIADIVGSYGLSLIILYVNILLFKATENLKQDLTKSVRFIAISFFIFLSVIIYGYTKISDSDKEKTIRVGIVQPNLDPWEKWQTGSLIDLLNSYFELSDKCIKDGAKLIIWPETALPVYLLSAEYSYLTDSIYSYIKRNNVYLLTGMPDFRVYYENPPKDAKYSEAGDYYFTTYNSILLFSPYSSEIQRYGKMHLVPLGEKVPFVESLPFLGEFFKWNVGISSWNTGQDTTIFKLTQGNDTISLAGLVCFESVFPSFVSEFAKNGAEFIVVVTNDSWYGNSSGPYQHKEFAALRAVENRKAVVRSANGGISCLINKYGVTEFETRMFTRTSFMVDVPLNEEITFYTKYSMIIPILSSAFSLWIVGIYFLMLIRIKLKL